MELTFNHLCFIRISKNSILCKNCIANANRLRNCDNFLMCRVSWSFSAFVRFHFRTNFGYFIHFNSFYASTLAVHEDWPSISFSRSSDSIDHFPLSHFWVCVSNKVQGFKLLSREIRMLRSVCVSREHQHRTHLQKAFECWPLMSK